MGHNFAGCIGVDNRVADCTALDRVIRFRLDHEIIGLSTARFICQSVSNREYTRCVCSHLGLHRVFLTALLLVTCFLFLLSKQDQKHPLRKRKNPASTGPGLYLL